MLDRAHDDPQATCLETDVQGQCPKPYGPQNRGVPVLVPVRASPVPFGKLGALGVQSLASHPYTHTPHIQRPATFFFFDDRQRARS